MKFAKLSLIIASILSISACQSIKATPNLPSQTTAKTPTSTTNEASDVFSTTLDNGLRVIIKKDTRAPIVMTQIWYNVGSSDEPVGKGGDFALFGTYDVQGRQRHQP